MKMTNTAFWTGTFLGILTGLGTAGGPRDRFDTAVAVSVVDGDTFANTGPVVVNSLLRATPSFDVGNRSGASTVDLRGLGSTRTLVLVDGKRRFMENIAVTAGVGSSGDPTNDGSSSRSFFDLNLVSGLVFERGPTTGALVIGGGITYYDDEVNNDDEDQLTWDLHAAFTGRREISQSVSLVSFVRGHYGDHGTLSTGYLRPGVLNEAVWDWRSRTSLDWRFDGAELGAEGWGFSTYYKTQAFLESGDDERDSLSFTIGQEVRRNLKGGTTVYGAIEYGQRNWEDWDIYDSETITGLVGVRNRTENGSYDLAVGWQTKEYDDVSGDDDNAYVDINYRRNLGDRTFFALKANYGVQQFFVNDGGPGLVDPVGTNLGARLETAFCEETAIGIHFNMLDVDSEFDGNDIHRGALGIDGKFRLGDSFTIMPSITWVNNDKSPTEEGDEFVWALRASHSF